MAPTSNKTYNICPKCKKRTAATTTCPTCTVCKKSYHKLCADLKYPTIPKEWKCAACMKITATTTRNNSPKNDAQNNSSMLINNPGHSLITIETTSKNESAIIGNLPETDSDELFKMVSTRRKRKKSNITLQNSFEPLSSIEDEDSNNHELVNTSYNETNYTNMLLYNRHNDTNNEQKLIYMEREITNLQERIKTAEKNIEILKTENISMRLVLAEHEKRMKDGAVMQRSPQPPPTPHLVRPPPPQPLPPPAPVTPPQSVSASMPPPITRATPATLRIKKPYVSENKNNCIGAQTDVTNSLKPKILLFGDQQLRGIASKIEELRAEKKDFEIFSFIKPFATSSQVLGSVKNNMSMIKKGDIVILAVGCNDNSSSNVLSPLKNTIYCLPCNNVFIMEIPSNLNLGTYLLGSLNLQLKGLSNKYSNVKFIEMTKNYTKIGSYYSKTDLSFKINIEIDFLNYKNNFLDYKNIKKNIHSKNPKIKKGTIPFLFEKQIQRNRNQKARSLCNAVPKGTIPYYFPAIKKQPLACTNITLPDEVTTNESHDFFRI